ncbi:MAG: type II toxin-antitoxin system HicB family antitoxin [bacterium]|nr:type II toxin-antitoxin system HicB family antitoxin [bacterium]
MNFQIVLEPCDVGGFTAYVPALPGCMSEGETEEEALANVRDAIRLYLEPIDEAFTSAAKCVREIAL